jgi:hypothetical protein
MKTVLSLVSLLAIFSTSVFADFKLRQQITIGVGGNNMTQERAVWVKGARERTESKMMTGDERVNQMMPVIADVRQCDLRQNLRINDRAKKYFIVPFPETDDKPLPSVQPSTRTETVKGGTVTWTYNLTDTGERREMFGLTARHLIIKQSMEASKDACGGESRMTIEEDGWFVYLIPETARCEIELPRPERRENKQICRDRIIRKGVSRYSGTMLEGTTKMIDPTGKNSMTTSVKTLELSKATLEMSLFEIPVGYAKVNDEQSLMSFGIGDMMSGGVMNPTINTTPQTNKKSVAVNMFSGDVSKINQANLRQYLAGKIPNGVLSNDTTSGAFQNAVGVEIKSVKESGASKVGGIFGKVTGNTDASKIGKSEAEIVITLYDKDGKTVIATATAKEKADGKADDAVKAAIDKALPQILSKLK